MKLIDFLLLKKKAITHTEARRLIMQGGIKINDELVIVKEHHNVEDITVQIGDVVNIGRKHTEIVS